MRHRAMYLGTAIMMWSALLSGCVSNPPVTQESSDSALELAMALPQTMNKEQGSSITFDHLMFESDSTVLTDESKRLIAFASAHLNEFPNTRAVIQGHADDTGSNDHNMTLSVVRAKNVRAHLLEYGVDSDRVVVSGFGEVRPIASNRTESGRQANRRAVIFFESLN